MVRALRVRRSVTRADPILMHDDLRQGVVYFMIPSRHIQSILKTPRSPETLGQQTLFNAPPSTGRKDLHRALIESTANPILSQEKLKRWMRINELG
jgi:hypothetical protein